MCYCLTVCERYPNHEVVLFQHWRVTTSKPRIYCLFLYSLLLNLPCPAPSFCCLMSFQGGSSLLPRFNNHQRLPYRRTVSSSHPGITRLHLSIPRTPPLSLTHRFQSPTPLPLPCPSHKYWIHVAADPSLQLKFLPM